jgi:hypothetical protein
LKQNHGSAESSVRDLKSKLLEVTCSLQVKMCRAQFDMICASVNEGQTPEFNGQNLKEGVSTSWTEAYHYRYPYR